jgi:hydroxymethylpyrimidine/phosphomethylpyrimidine kinase
MKYYTTEDCRTVFLRIKEKALKNVFIDVPSDDEKCGTLLNVDQIEAVHENWNDSRSADIVMGNKTITTPLKVPEVLALIAQVKSEKIDP